MAEYISKTALYGEVAKLEELARNRYLDTPSNSPAYPRYTAQMQERTALKHLIADFPAADVAPVRPELRRSVKELHKQYERAINNPAVRNPLAWALYRTWVMMEGEANEK